MSHSSHKTPSQMDGAQLLDSKAILEDPALSMAELHEAFEKADR